MSKLLLLFLVGFIWGSSNPLIKRGSQIVEARSNEQSQASAPGGQQLTTKPGSSFVAFSRSFAVFWLNLLSDWQYVIPFLVNLSGSVLFYATLSEVEISVAVPVANATTFFFTAIVGSLLGEPVDFVYTGAGLGLVVLGMYLCVV